MRKGILQKIINRFSKVSLEDFNYINQITIQRFADLHKRINLLESRIDKLENKHKECNK